MQWYYSKGGVQHGPVPANELQAKLGSGEIAASELVWKEGMSNWIPASQVEALRRAPQAEGPKAPAPDPVTQGVVPSPYSPPAAAAWSPPGPRIPTYLWQSIVMTLLCWPFGIPAIVYAAKVDGLQARGDIQGALAASKTAKTWCWVAFGSWLAIIFLALLSGGIN